MKPEVKARLERFIKCYSLPVERGGSFCSCCGAGAWTYGKEFLPVGVGYSTTKEALFSLKPESHPVHGYEVEEISIPFKAGFLNLQVTKNTSDTKYIGPYSLGVIDPKSRNQVDVNDEELVQVYSHGTFVYSYLDGALPKILWDDINVMAGTDFTKEEYLELVKERMKGKTAVFIFKISSDYAITNKMAKDLIEEMGAETLYETPFTNRNSALTKNTLELKVVKFP